MTPLETGTDVICKVTGEWGYIVSWERVEDTHRFQYEVHWHHSNQFTIEPRENLIPQYPTVRP